MYTDKDYYIKDGFQAKSYQGSVRTLYRSRTGLNVKERESRADPGLYPDIDANDIKTVLNCPPGLEVLASLTKLYLNKRLEVVEKDELGTYKGELINEEGNRIFLLTRSVHYDSNEVIHYEKHKKLKMKGKICYGVINYAGVQVFEIYGDPEKVIRVGPNSAVWGEIQLIPAPFCELSTFLKSCCCCSSDNTKNNQREIQVVVLKKDLGEKQGPYHQHAPVFKQTYVLRGKVDSGGCCGANKKSIIHKKFFDLQIYTNESLENPEVEETTTETMEVDHDPTSPTHGKHTKRIIHRKRIYIPKPVGRISSDELHEKLNCHLPILEIPETMDVYDKITLMGTFFMFSLL